MIYYVENHDTDQAVECSDIWTAARIYSRPYLKGQDVRVFVQVHDSAHMRFVPESELLAALEEGV